MQPSLREDILEALSIQHCSGRKAFRIEDLARALGRPEDDIREILPSLESEGDLAVEDERIILSPSGQAAGGKITRKHRILECFFKEMLGMSPGTASEEACTLEHQVSDEAIDRLRTYLRSAQAGDRIGGGTKSSPLLPTLMESPVETDLVVSCIRCQIPVSRLHDLGIVPGERIRIVRKIAGNGIVVRVKECDIALSREIAGSIYVEKAA